MTVGETTVLRRSFADELAERAGRWGIAAIERDLTSLGSGETCDERIQDVGDTLNRLASAGAVDVLEQLIVVPRGCRLPTQPSDGAGLRMIVVARRPVPRQEEVVALVPSAGWVVEDDLASGGLRRASISLSVALASSYAYGVDWLMEELPGWPGSIVRDLGSNNPLLACREIDHLAWCGLLEPGRPAYLYDRLMSEGWEGLAGRVGINFSGRDPDRIMERVRNLASLVRAAGVFAGQQEHVLGSAMIAAEAFKSALADVLDRSQPQAAAV